MKKIRLSSIAIALMVLLLVPSVAFAQDPPDLDVDIGISTPGDVDVDIGIDAGGDVDVTIDGVGFPHEHTSTTGTNHFMWDFTYYWQITGIGLTIERQILELQQMCVVLLNANAKLIIATEQSAEEQENIVARLATLGDETSESLGQLKADAKFVTEALHTRDNKIWNQLMYGAEVHIAVLDAQLASQEIQISNLQTELTSLEAQMGTANANSYALRNYVDYLQRQYLYYFWIIGGVVILISTLLVVSLLRNRR